MSSSKHLHRIDLDLYGQLADYIDNLLSVEESDALTACAEAIYEHNSHSRLAPGIQFQTPSGMRLNMAAHWYMSRSAAPAFFGPLFDRISHLIPPTLGGLPLHSALSEKIAHFKYGDGDRFYPHTDGEYPGQGCNVAGDGVDQWPGVQTGMSILIYLNDASDGFVGGETRLWTADRSRFIDVQPCKGRGLFFRHGSGPDSVLHAGLAVSGDVPKYIVRINLAFGVRHGTDPFYCTRYCTENE